MAARRFFVSVDLGQSHDFTAISVVERVEWLGEWDQVLFGRPTMTGMELRYLQRIPLGTEYPDVVSRVVDVVRSDRLDGCCELLVDATGVGRPVVDMLRRSRLNCTLIPVMVTSGFTESRKDGYYHVPKRDLITGLQIALQQGTLGIAAGMQYCDKLMEEMREMRVRITTAGNEQFGAWREGSHDDLVFAVALGVLGGEEELSVGWGRGGADWREVRSGSLFTTGCRRMLSGLIAWNAFGSRSSFVGTDPGERA